MSTGIIVVNESIQKHFHIAEAVQIKLQFKVTETSRLVQGEEDKKVYTYTHSILGYVPIDPRKFPLKYKNYIKDVEDSVEMGFANVMNKLEKQTIYLPIEQRLIPTHKFDGGYTRYEHGFILVDRAEFDKARNLKPGELVESYKNGKEVAFGEGNNCECPNYTIVDLVDDGNLIVLEQIRRSKSAKEPEDRPKV